MSFGHNIYNIIIQSLIKLIMRQSIEKNSFRYQENTYNNNMYKTVQVLSDEDHNKLFGAHNTSKINKQDFHGSISTLDRQIRKKSLKNKQRSRRMNSTFNPEITNSFKNVNEEHHCEVQRKLPKIDKKPKELILEDWLNDALQSESPLQQKKTLQAPLSTLKHFSIDKQFLKNNNITNTQINTIYKSLFIYSQAIKNMFKQVLQMGVNHNKGEENKMAQIFWKVFMKLFDNNSTVKSCFSHVQEKYEREIAGLRRKLVEEAQRFNEIDREKSTKIEKMEREAKNFNRKYDALKKQDEILNSTLILTQQNLNEQITLRLEFESRINSVYTTYKELQQKYNTLREDIQHKRQILNQNYSNKKELQSRLLSQTIKKQELINIVDIKDAKLRDIGEQLNIRLEQINELNQEVLALKKGKEDKEDYFDNMTAKIKEQKHEIKEMTHKISNYEKMVIDLQGSTVTLKDTLKNARQKNDEIYLKIAQKTQTINQLENNLHQTQQTLLQTQSQLANTKHTLSIANNQTHEQSQTINTHLETIAEHEQTITNKQKQIQITKKHFESIKQVKDRFQRINAKLNQELEQERSFLNEKKRQLMNMNEQYTEVLGEKESLERFKLQLEAAVLCKANQKMQVQEKCQRQLRIKEKAIVEVGKEVKAKEQIIEKVKAQNSKLESQVILQNSLQVQKLQQISFLRKKTEQMEGQLKKKTLLIVQNEKDLQTETTQKQILQTTLKGKQHAYKTKNKQIDSQIIALKMSLAKKQKLILERQQYVSPMIVQDLVEQLRRVREKMEGIIERNKHIYDDYDWVVGELKGKEEVLEEVLLEKKKAQEELDSVRRENVKGENKYEERIRQINNKIKDRDCKNESAVSQLNRQNTDLNATLLQKTKLIEKLNLKIEQLEAQIYQYQSKKKHYSTQQTQTSTFQIDQQIQVNIIHNISSKKLISPLQSSQKIRLEQKQTNQLQNEKIEEIQKSQKIETKEKTDKPQKKVEGKQFKKALKLTYMRRE